MHLGNSIICPVTGIPMLALVGATALWAFKKARKDFKKENILPAVMLTTLVFGLQMINFSIPATGSSGHIVGAMLLAILLGPYTGFLAICSILLIQALFFADGGLMALGCNIFNMGFLACFVAYPLVYKPLNRNIFAASILSSIVALQLGAAAVVAESALSGSITANIGFFAFLMQGIHLPIGIVEGIFTSAIVITANKTNYSKMFSYTTGAVSLILAGIISRYASAKPDGLEWSLLNMSDSFVAQTQGQIYTLSEILQAKTSILASIPPVYANLTGLFIVAVLMIVISEILTIKKAEVYDE